MTLSVRQMTDALLHRIMVGEGPFKLQKLIQSQRMAGMSISVDESLAMLIDADRAERGAELRERLARRGIGIIGLLEDAYPQALKHIADPPLVLFYKGNHELLNQSAVSVVGSRRNTAYGAQATRLLVQALVACQQVVISGLAMGIDALAHRACLEFKGQTIAVLAGGVDPVSPACNRSLADDILASGGLLVSELPPGAALKPFYFPIRNRIVSGLSVGTLVIEAALRSGSLVTARHCLDQGRECLAVPGPITSSMSEGPNHLIASGQAHAVISPAAILEILGTEVPQESAIQAPQIEDPQSASVYQHLDCHEGRTVDELAVQTQLSAGTISRLLIDLEQAGLIQRLPGASYLKLSLPKAYSGGTVPSH